jgi:hypothetical protein
MEYPTGLEAWELSEQPASSDKYSCALAERLDSLSECADDRDGDVEAQGHCMLFSFNDPPTWATVWTYNLGFVTCNVFDSYMDAKDDFLMASE